MVLKDFITGIIVSNSLFGSFCLMPMAMAATEAQATPQHDEMNMSPMDAMSHADCDHCKPQKQNNDSQSGGCAGHCLAATDNTAAINANSTQCRVQGILPVITAPVLSVAITRLNNSESHSRPSQVIGTHTIVLRQ